MSLSVSHNLTLCFSNQMAIELQELVDTLNEFVELDPQAAYFLRVFVAPANQALVDSPNFICNLQLAEDFPYIRLVGILNGLASKHGYHIAEQYGEPDALGARPFQKYVLLPAQEGT